MSIYGRILRPVNQPASGSGPRRPRYDPESLLAVAVQLFIRRGYEATSMAALGEAAGLRKSSIYHHFASKEAILRRAVGRALDALFAILEEEPTRVGPAAARLEHLLRRTVEVLIQELPYVTLLLRVRGNSKTEIWALERRRQFDREVAGLVAAATRSGELRADLDPHLGARLLLGMVNSISEWYRPGGVLTPAELAAATAAVGLHGVGGIGRVAAKAAPGPPEPR